MLPQVGNQKCLTRLQHRCFTAASHKGAFNRNTSRFCLVMKKLDIGQHEAEDGSADLRGGQAFTRATGRLSAADRAASSRVSDGVSALLQTDSLRLQAQTQTSTTKQQRDRRSSGTSEGQTHQKVVRLVRSSSWRSRDRGRRVPLLGQTSPLHLLQRRKSKR